MYIYKCTVYLECISGLWLPGGFDIVVRGLLIYCLCHQNFTLAFFLINVRHEFLSIPNAEFQRIARRDKKAFLSDQCKEIEKNNRMGKTRDLFKKIRDTKGTFHAKMGTIKVRNGMDLTEAEDIKQRWHEYTEELPKKIFMTQITMMV